MDTVSEELQAEDERQKKHRVHNASSGLNDDGTPIGQGDGRSYQRGRDYDVAPRQHFRNSANLLSFLFFQNELIGENLAAALIWGFVIVLLFFFLESQGIYLLPLK